MADTSLPRACGAFFALLFACLFMHICVPGTQSKIHLGSVWSTLSSSTKGTAQDDNVQDARVGAIALRVVKDSKVTSAAAFALGGALPDHEEDAPETEAVEAVEAPAADTSLEEKVEEVVAAVESEDLASARQEIERLTQVLAARDREINDLRLQLGADEMSFEYDD
jgi:predicted house-cleaning noncanonical NTP pyrophosphatase (MazG superfamily)